MANDSLFLRLPTEIRLQIYGHLYEPPEGKLPVEASFPIWGSAPIWLHKLELRGGNLYAACSSTKRSFWPMLQVCKLVNEELQDHLFERLLFTIFISSRNHEAEMHCGPPLLGAAKDFAFWRRVRRILLVTFDSTPSGLRSVPLFLGTVFRCFKSTPQDTTTFLYLKDNAEFGDFFGSARKSNRYGRGIGKSLSSLSMRTHFEFEVSDIHSLGGRNRFIEIVDAVHGSAKLASCDSIRSRWRSGDTEQRVLSTETVDKTVDRHQTPRGSAEPPKRTVCWMSEQARYYTTRARALQRRRYRSQLNKERSGGEIDSSSALGYLPQSWI